MYTIDYKDSSYLLTFGNLQSEEFTDEVNYLKSLWLTYSSEKKSWVISSERVDEILLWFDKHGKDYKLTSEAYFAFSELRKTYEQEAVFNRTASFSENNFNGTLLPKQKEIADWCLRRSSFINACDTGIGKSPITIACMSQLYSEGKIQRFIIVVPLGLEFHWKHEILNFSPYFKEEDFLLVNNDNKIQPYSKDKKIFIVSNHIFAASILSYRKDYNARKSAKNIRWGSSKFTYKSFFGNDKLCLIVDESHGIKHSDAVKTKAALSVKKDFSHRWLLSATPNINKFEHIYTQAFLVDKSIIPMSENAFKLYISDSIGSKYNKYDITRYNVDKVAEVRNSLKKFMIQVMKKDIPEFTVEKYVKQLYLELHPIQRQLYRLICEKELHILQEDFDVITWKMILNKFHSIMKVIDCPSLLKKNTYNDIEISKVLDTWKLSYDPKFNLLSTLLEYEIGELNEKVIVYDPSPHILDLLHDNFKKYNPLIIHGSLKDEKDKNKERQEKVDLFNTDDSYKLFLLSTHTSSSGLNLQKKCRRIKFYSVSNDATENRQAQDRVYRITSTEDVLVDIFCYPNTVDNIRVQRSLNRIELNDKMNKEISQEELGRLLRGIV